MPKVFGVCTGHSPFDHGPLKFEAGEGVLLFCVRVKYASPLLRLVLVLQPVAKEVCIS